MSNEQQVENSAETLKALMNLCPLESEITLVIDGKKEDFTLRKYTLLDAQWGQSKFGDKYEDVINNFGSNLEDFARLVYRLIKEKDKIKPYTRVEQDEDGEEIEVRMNAPRIILDGMEGGNALMTVYGAVLKTIGHSEPIKENKKDIKKNTAKKKKS